MTMYFQNLSPAKKDILIIAGKNLPLSFFDDGLTREYFKDLNGERKHPRKNAMRQMVLDEHKNMVDNLQEIFCKCESKISFCVDGWTSANFECFYGVTTHFLNVTQDLMSASIDLIPAKRKHSGKDIA